MQESVARSIKASIDCWAERLLRESGLARVARQGALGPRAMALYLESLRYIFLHSERNIRVAAARADTLQLRELAAHFRQKAGEESGHAAWAAQDLLRLPSRAVQGIEPAAASRALVALQGELLAWHPLCFLAYAVWAEYLTALLGAEWLRMLARCGYERAALTAVANHLDADEGHALAGFEALDRLWHGEPTAQLLVAGVERAECEFEAFCDEICELAQTSAAGDVCLNLRG